MDTKLLLEILNTRIIANEENPTGKSLLYELVTALERLKCYEDKEALHGKNYDSSGNNS